MTPVSQIQASLAQARDAQVARVVALVDAMPERGVADALIAPLRPRLAQLGVDRPLGFTRLLVTPLNPVIMPLPAWQRSAIGVPRPALSVLGRTVLASLPDYADWQGDWDGLVAAGMMLWPKAAAVLETMPMPRDWFDVTGLAANQFAGVVKIASAVLHEAVAIERLARTREPIPNGDILAILSRSRTRGAAALDTVVSVMLARLPVPSQVALLAVEAAGNDRAIGRAIDRLAATLTTPALDASDLREASVETCRIVAMIDALDCGASADRRAQLEQIRREADVLNRRTFGRAVDQFVTLAQSAMSASFDDTVIAGLEAFARDLRRLATISRRLGGADEYDGRLEATAAAVQTVGGDLGFADRIRLVEILAGPEQALAMMTGLRDVTPIAG